MTVPLALLIGVLFAVGVYLVMQRNLTRVLVGLGVLAHAVNVMLITAGADGDAPIVTAGGGPYADPLPQALILTAIVITFGVTAFLLGLALRGWAGEGDDVVEDDLEDRRIQRSGGGGAS